MRETRYTLWPWKEGGRTPDYMHIIKETASKEFVTAVRRTIQYEKVQPETVHHIKGQNTFDVVLIEPERVIIIRHLLKTTKCLIQGFRRESWDKLHDPAQPNLTQFLTAYDEQIQKLDPVWLPKKDISII